MHRMRLSFALLSIALVGLAPACAAVPDAPTIGDIDPRDNLAESLRARQRAINSTADFNGRITIARERYFSSPDASPERKAIEAEFAALLRDKDILNLIRCITDGMQDGIVRAQIGGLFADNDRPVDNGIPSAAQPTFSDWATAVRASLGAKDDKEQLSPKVKAFAAALETNADAYASYKVVRDKAEYEMWNHVNGTQVPGHLLLAKQQILGETPTHKDSDPQMLVCAYGPIHAPDGSEKFIVRTLWYQSPPARLKRLLEIDTTGEFKAMGDKGYERCPAADGQVQ